MVSMHDCISIKFVITEFCVLDLTYTTVLAWTVLAIPAEALWSQNGCYSKINLRFLQVAISCMKLVYTTLANVDVLRSLLYTKWHYNSSVLLVVFGRHNIDSLNSCLHENSGSISIWPICGIDASNRMKMY